MPCLWVVSCLAYAQDKTVEDFGAHGCIECGNWRREKMHFVPWSRFCSLRESDQDFSAEVDADMENFTAPGVGGVPHREWNPQSVVEVVESGFEVYTNVRIATEKEVKDFSKKVLNKMPSTMMKLTPKGPTQKVWLFLDDSPDAVGLTKMRAFTKVTVKQSALKLDAADHSFKSLGEMAFNDSLEKHALKFGDVEIDFDSLPSFAEHFCIDEEAPSEEERERGRQEGGDPSAATRGLKGSSSRAAAASPLPKVLRSPPAAPKASPQHSPVAPRKAGGQSVCGSLSVEDHQDLDDTKSMLSEVDTTDLSTVPPDLEAACAFWIAKMPLDKILAGHKLGHAIRQGMDLVTKNSADEEKFGIVTSLNLHCKLAAVARSMAPGKKFIETLKDSDLLDGAEKLLAASVPLPLHVNEQFLFRRISNLKDQMRTAPLESWCENFVATVVPWQRDEAKPFDTHRPTVSALEATDPLSFGRFAPCSRRRASFFCSLTSSDRRR